ncbi:CsbD family protein [Curtobacterium sp. MCBD17_019]|uniref:CsbD family protein n=1 Tax=Curtobacterium sp. MCBD17_019 TaxID=2175669 RepID=UPI000DA71AF5|nr:CsbD family protein [Curtobacterium sp. MCBD17_019]PZE77616.1 CsbD family protein [Curtobacterium sp. MCBD17_019]
MAGTEDMKNNGEKLLGKAKEAFGDATGNDRLKTEGQTDQAKGSAKQGVTDVKDAAHGVADSFKDK